MPCSSKMQKLVRELRHVTKCRDYWPLGEGVWRSWSMPVPFLNLGPAHLSKGISFVLHFASCFSLVCLPSLFPASRSYLCLFSGCPAKKANKPRSHVVIPPNPMFPTFPNTNLLSGSDFGNQPLQGCWPVIKAGREKVRAFL